MINTLTGEIIPADSGVGYITLKVNGVGYQVMVVARTDMAPQFYETHLNGIPAKLISDRKFYIHENIVAAAQGPSKYDLYGFETERERALFRALMKNCDKVGPVAAMKAMNIAPPSELLQAIRMGSEKYMERGVGAETAKRILLGMAKYAVSEPMAKPKELL